MKYNNQHHTFIIISKLKLVAYLDTDNLWTDLIGLLGPLITPIKGVNNITASQYISGEGQLKLGRLNWKADILQKLVDNYRKCNKKDKFQFDYFSGFFPNLTTCVKKETTPDITLTISDAYNEHYFGSGFLISFREDYFDNLGESFILEQIEKISILLMATTRLRNKSIYAKKSENYESWSESIQDFSPTAHVNIPKENSIKVKGFREWQAF